MISIIEVFTSNERAFARNLPRSARKRMGIILAKGASMKGDLAQGFGGSRKHYQRSFEKLALRKAGYNKDLTYLGVTPVKKETLKRRAA